MPSASMRAVTSAELPAGNRQVISMGALCGYSCEKAGRDSSARRINIFFM